MTPIGYRPHGKKGLILFFRCTRCGEVHNNKAFTEDPLASDDMDKILSLGAR
jgi:hypothetical protein